MKKAPLQVQKLFVLDQTIPSIPVRVRHWPFWQQAASQRAWLLRPRELLLRGSPSALNQGQTSPSFQVGCVPQRKGGALHFVPFISQSGHSPPDSWQSPLKTGFPELEPSPVQCRTPRDCATVGEGLHSLSTLFSDALVQVTVSNGYLNKPPWHSSDLTVVRVCTLKGIWKSSYGSHVHTAPLC